MKDFLLGLLTATTIWLIFRIKEDDRVISSLEYENSDLEESMIRMN